MGKKSRTARFLSGFCYHASMFLAGGSFALACLSLFGEAWFSMLFSYIFLALGGVFEEEVVK